MNRPKKIGTAAESATVKFLRANGFPHAERRALRGTEDAGDVTGTPDVCWEIKGGNAARTTSDLLVAAWMTELEIERSNARASVGVLVVQRAGVGPANAGRWWAYMPIGTAAVLRLGLINPEDETWQGFPVRMLLADAVSLLRSAGYGEPVVPDGR